MQLGQIVISLMFLFTSIIYLYWGIYVFRTNTKNRINVSFLLICIAMSIWSFSFSMANIAGHIKTALIWRRISAIGWTSVYSLMLHFLILLSNRNLDSKQRGFLGLLHIPAIINMYVFSFSNKLAILQYNLLKTDFGWTNISYSNKLDYFFRVYYILYILISILIVCKWQKKLKDEEIAKRARLIVYSLVASSTLGTLVDIVLTALLKKATPQLGPIFILLPTGAMYYTIKYFDIFRVEALREKEIFLTREEQDKIFKNISLGFYTAATLAFFSEYIPYFGERDVFKSALLKALVIYSVGFIIKIIQRIKEDSKKRILTMIFLTISVPIILFLFREYATITVWAFPIIIVIGSTIFSDRVLLVSITIVSIITQILIWVFYPQTSVVIDQYDFILRIGMHIVAFFIALSINIMYLSKIKENNNKIDFQNIVSEVLFDFLEINLENFNDRINNLLEKIGELFNVDRTYLFTINQDNVTMTYSNEWCNIGINAEVGTIEEIPLDVFPWWIKELKTKKMVYIENVDQMPEEASEEQAQLHRQKVKSLVSVPIFIDNKLEAFIGIDSVLEKKIWSSESIEMLNIMANILSTGIMQLKADKEIENMAYYDNLTGLPNRFLFEDRVKYAIATGERNERLVSLMLIDLDDFKLVNDTMGHDAGDLLLKEISNRFSNRIRKVDTVSRFGGDEFLLLFNNIKDYKDVPKIAVNIMDAFLKPFNIKGQELFITASGGIATYPMDGKDSQTLFKSADIAMYEAKAKGKNQYSLCTTYMREKTQNNMELSNDLYRALERNELSVFYQPQLNLETKKIIGMEALLRWYHPQFGMVYPGVFIPLAEKNGLINSIGKWVLEVACSQNKKWHDMGFSDLKIAVNLSAIQLINEQIVNDVDQTLKETNLDPKYLELEITESIAIKETNIVISVLNKLKEIGVSIAIDDFGVEYSSFSRLKDLPIDKIKIDREFVKGIDRSEKEQAIIMIIINMAKSLGMDVLAEGVEITSQVDFLNQKMCNYVQGYYYYKPMPAEEAEKILKRSKD